MKVIAWLKVNKSVSNKLSPQLTIVMPCYKISERDVLSSIKDVKSFFIRSNIPIEIIISQNGMRKPFDIKIVGVKIVFTKTKGLGIGLRNGISASRTKYFYFLPPDIPYAYTDFLRMFPIRMSHDFIVGSKLHNESKYDVSILRVMLTKIQRLFTAICLKNFYIKDPNGTLFGDVSKAKLLLSLVRSDDFFFQTEFLFYAIKNKFSVVEVPVIYKKIDGKTTVNFLKDPFMYMSRLFSLSLRELSL